MRFVQGVRGKTRGSYCSLWGNKRLWYPNAATHQSGLYTFYTFICIYIYIYIHIYIYIYTYITYINTINNMYIYIYYTNGALNWWVPNRMATWFTPSDLMNPMNQSWWQWLSLPLWKMMDFVSWDHDIPNIYIYIWTNTVKHVPKHQAERPTMIQSFCYIIP